MDPHFIEARELIVKAREAMRRGDKASAWKMGEQAALLAPDMENAWLILAASDPDPDEALAYAQKALQINPSSARAHKAVEWANDKLKQAASADLNPSPVLHEAAVSFAQIAPVTITETPQPQPKSDNRKWIYAASFLGLLLCVVLAFAAYSAVTHPAFASILHSAPAAKKADHWAAMDLPKPSVTPIKASAFAPPAASSTPLPKPTAKNPPQKAATPTPSEIPTEEPTATPAATETPASLAMSAVEDTPTTEYVAPAPSGELPDIAKSGNGTRWIDVDLTNQSVYAYEGDTVVNSFIVSTGTWMYPTVTGQYKVYVKYRYADMHGPGYYLRDVPYVMYFYKSYGLHGTYWHHNFGTPMSHGCVNLSIEDAGWLYNWASVGTVVNVHN
ncbi:MAG TPA: L,D-transpeptidase family protein [Anaerolineales bacterium]|nr:L,D-transpeptidase family protein [Anaerolineales bacterium]